MLRIDCRTRSCSRARAALLACSVLDGGDGGRRGSGAVASLRALRRHDILVDGAIAVGLLAVLAVLALRPIPLEAQIVRAADLTSRMQHLPHPPQALEIVHLLSDSVAALRRL